MQSKLSAPPKGGSNMSMATRATTAKQRATIAIRMLKTQKHLYRAFVDCFEMFDGQEVKRIIIERAKKDDTLLARCRSVFNWPELPCLACKNGFVCYETHPMGENSRLIYEALKP